jgi:hypothetical protein
VILTHLRTVPVEYVQPCTKLKSHEPFVETPSRCKCLIASRSTRMSSHFFAATGVLLFGVGTQALCGVRTHQVVHQIFGIVGDVIQPLATSTPAKPCARSSSVPATPWRKFVRGARFNVTTPYLGGVERPIVALEAFLATEVARAESADEGFGGTLSQ